MLDGFIIEKLNLDLEDFNKKGKRNKDNSKNSEVDKSSSIKTEEEEESSSISMDINKVK